jgi:hypothetical protein
MTTRAHIGASLHGSKLASMGARSFGGVSLVIVLQFWVLNASYSYYRYLEMERHPWEYEFWERGWLQGFMLFELGWVGLSALVFPVAAWFMGRIATRWIVVKKRHFAWVGPLAMVVPWVISAAFSLPIAQWLSNGKFLGQGDHFWEGIPLAMALVALWFLLPAIASGLLSGFIVHHWGRNQALQTQLPEIETWA